MTKTIARQVHATQQLVNLHFRLDWTKKTIVAIEERASFNEVYDFVSRVRSQVTAFFESKKKHLHGSSELKGKIPLIEGEGFSFLTQEVTRWIIEQLDQVPHPTKSLCDFKEFKEGDASGFLNLNNQDVTWKLAQRPKVKYTKRMPRQRKPIHYQLPELEKEVRQDKTGEQAPLQENETLPFELEDSIRKLSQSLPTEPLAKAKKALDFCSKLHDIFWEGLKDEMKPVILKLIQDVPEQFEDKQKRAFLVNGLLDAMKLSIDVHLTDGQEYSCSVQISKANERDTKGYFRYMSRKFEGSTRKAISSNSTDIKQIRISEIERSNSVQQSRGR